MQPMLSGPLGVLVSAGLLGAAAAGADWPRFRGPDANGISPETGINKDWRARPPKLLWQVPMSDDSYAGPSAAAGKVFIIDHQGDQDIVKALELGSGRELWRFSYKDANSSNYGFSRSTPTYDDGRLYTVSRLGLVHCLNAATGAKIWSLDMVAAFGGRRPQWDYAWSALVDGPRLVLVPGGDGAAVAAVDKMTGRTLWKGGGNDRPGYATPVSATINGRKQYVVFTAEGVIGVDQSTGARLWGCQWKTSYDVNAATPLVIGNGVFITSDYRRGCAMVAVGPSGAQIAWENKEMHSHFSTPVYYNGFIYGTTDPGRLVCLDPKTGQVRWQQRGFEKGGLVAVDGTLIVCDGANGDVAMVELKPDGYTELGRFRPLGGQSWTAPIVADGKLIVRNKTALACLDLK